MPARCQRAAGRRDRLLQHDDRIAGRDRQVRGCGRAASSPCRFSARSLTTSAPEAPSQIWLALAAVIMPPSCSSFTDADHLQGRVVADALVAVHLAAPSGPSIGERQDLAARTRRPASPRRRAGGSPARRRRAPRGLKPYLSAIICRADELAEVLHPVALLDARTERADADALLGVQRSGVPIGTRVMLSTPPAITTSCVPDITACAAKCSACCDEPHCRSMVTAGTLSGSLEASTTLRPSAKALLAGLADAADDHVLDRRRIDAGALDERVQHLARPCRPDATRRASRRGARPPSEGLRRCRLRPWTPPHPAVSGYSRCPRGSTLLTIFHPAWVRFSTR